MGMKKNIADRKRGIAALLAAAVFGSINMSVMASETNPWIGGSTGKENAEYNIPPLQEKAINILGGLGIIEDVYYTKEICTEPITRIDAATILYNFSGHKKNGGVIKNAEIEFDDVEYNEILSYIVGEKIMQGTSESNFSPEGNVTYEALCKIISAFMGYTDYAEHFGGYPGGYVKAATSRNLVDVKIENSTAVTNGEFALCLYNLFDEHKLRPEFIGATSEYKAEDEDVLYQNFGIRMSEDVVNATPYGSTGRVFQSGHGAYIGDNVYNLSKYSVQEVFELSELIGRKVEYYYSADNKEEQVLELWYADDALSEVTGIKASDIERISANTIYTEDKNYRVNPKAVVIKNKRSTGKSFDMYTENELIPKTGNIKLIDNDSDGSVDFCMVSDYINVVADAVNERNYTIQNKYQGSQILVDPDAEYPIISKNGRLAAFSDIKEWTVLGVLISDSGEITSVEISEYSPIEGTVSSFDGDECVIGENTYVVSDNYTVASAASIAPDKIRLGVETTFYLNVEGEIIAIKAGISSKTTLIAYIVSAVMNDEDCNVRIKAFTEDGDMKVFVSDDKVLVDDITYTTYEEIYNALAPSRKVRRGLAKLRVTSKDEVKEIKYPVDTALNPGEYDGELTFDAYAARREWRGAHKKFEYTGTEADPSAREFWTTSDTVVFGVPSSYDGAEDDVKFSIFDPSAFSDSAAYLVEGYNIDEEYNAGVVVAQLANTAYINGSYTRAGIITGMFDTINEAGDLAKGIKILIDGSEQKYLISEDADISMFQKSSTAAYIPISAEDLKRGDTVRLAVDSNGEAGAISRHLPDSKGGTIDKPNTSFLAGRGTYGETAYGKLIKRASNTFTIEALSGGKNVQLPYRVTGSTNIYIYDMKNNEIYKGTASDIPDKDVGAYAFIKALDNDVEDVIVYLY